jgi:hypothetical protein
VAVDGAEDVQALAQHDQPPQAPDLQESAGTIGQGRMEEVVIVDGTEGTAVPQEAESRGMNVRDRTNIGSDPGHRANKKKSLILRRDPRARRTLTGLSLKAPSLNLPLARS